MKLSLTGQAVYRVELPAAESDQYNLQHSAVKYEQTFSVIYWQHYCSRRLFRKLSEIIQKAMSMNECEKLGIFAQYFEL